MNNRNYEVEHERIAIDLVEMIKNLWKNAWIIVLVTVVFAAIGFAMNGGDVEPEYESSTRVLFQGDGDLTSLAETAKSDENLEKVIERAGIKGLKLADLKDYVSVTKDGSVSVVTVTVTYHNAKQAKLLADTVRDVFVEDTQALLEQEVYDYSEVTGEEIFTTVGKQMHLRLLEVLNDANLPKESVTSGAGKQEILLGLVGFMFAVVVLVLRYLVKATAFPINRPDDVNRYLDEDVLAVIPEQKEIGEDPAEVAFEGDRVLLNLKHLDPGAEEAFRFLRTNLKSDKKGSNVFSFVGTSEEEGNTTVSLYTAKALAEAGNKVLYIESDIHTPFLKGEKGICEFLRGEAEASAIIHATDYEGLNVILSGSTEGTSEEMFAKETFNEFIRECREVYDYVILDTPPMRSFIDGAVLGSISDGVVIVIRSEKVSCRLVRRAQEQLERMGCRSFGVVLNRADIKGDSYYGKYYYSYEEKKSKIQLPHIVK